MRFGFVLGLSSIGCFYRHYWIKERQPYNFGVLFHTDNHPYFISEGNFHQHRGQPTTSGFFPIVMTSVENALVNICRSCKKINIPRSLIGLQTAVCFCFLLRTAKIHLSYFHSFSNPIIGIQFSPSLIHIHKYFLVG